MKRNKKIENNIVKIENGKVKIDIINALFLSYYYNCSKISIPLWI